MDVKDEATASVVVPAHHDRARRVGDVVEPLLADPATAELVVVLDGESPAARARLEELTARDSRVQVVAVENAGEMGAREAGAQVASGDILVFVDADVIAEPGLVSGHVRAHAGRERHVVVGYMPVPEGVVRRRGDFATRLYALDYERRCEQYERDPASVLTNLWGGNFSMRRADCMAVGLRNPGYGERYHPDRDFGLRCARAGFTGIFDRSLLAFHAHERSLPLFVSDAQSQGAGRALIHALHGDLLAPLTGHAFAAGLPLSGRFLLRATRRRRVHAVAAWVLRRAIGAAGRAGAYGAQETAARMLRRIEQQRGAIDFMAGRRSTVGQGRVGTLTEALEDPQTAPVARI